MAFSPTVTAYYAISVRRISVLPSAFFRFHLTMDTLAVRLIVPLAGSIVDFHHQVIQPPPRVLEQRQLRRYAPYLAHQKKSPAKRPGNKGGIGLGMPIPSAREREVASLRRATAYSKKRLLTINMNQIDMFFILIKDYPLTKSKKDRQTVGIH